MMRPILDDDGYVVDHTTQEFDWEEWRRGRPDSDFQPDVIDDPADMEYADAFPDFDLDNYPVIGDEW